MAKITASASGENRYFATPERKKDRNKNDADTQGRHESREGNLSCTIANRVQRRLTFSQVTIDVFDRHRGVVDENANRQGEPAQGHDVERLSEGTQHGDRSKNCKRN